MEIEGFVELYTDSARANEDQVFEELKSLGFDERLNLISDVRVTTVLGQNKFLVRRGYNDASFPPIPYIFKLGTNYISTNL